LEQAKKVHDLSLIALKNYDQISTETNITMHSKDTALKRFDSFYHDLHDFKTMSRDNAKNAQHREASLTQPKELINDQQKAMITIENFLKGVYYFTVDEARIDGESIFLTEAKHTTKESFPSLNDILDGLMKMVVFCNLEHVCVDSREYQVKPVLKLTSAKPSLSERNKMLLKKLHEEADLNGFEIVLQ